MTNKSSLKLQHKKYYKDLEKDLKPINVEALRDPLQQLFYSFNSVK